MSHRVNIQYSVEIEELDTEVQRLLETTLSQLDVQTLESLSEFKDVFIYPLAVLCTLPTVETIGPHSLAIVDHGLRDVNNIIAAYLNFQAQEYLEPPPSEIVPTDPQLLEEKIAQFKDLAGDDTSHEIPD
jgi:hypothetical protein